MMSAENSPTCGADDAVPLTPSPQEIEQELQRILSSSYFCKAHSSSRMLRFLVEQVQRGTLRETSEYAVGIAVFRRDASTYSTGDDPIVRVQAGRLRQKLEAYYSGDGAHSQLRINIPVGSYRPQIMMVSSATAAKRLAVQPLVCISEQAMARQFALGLNEELSYRLYRDFGPQVASGGVPQAHPGTVSHVLRGSVRQDDTGFRTALRLLDLRSDCVTWSTQYDHGVDLSISCQEKLALDCCSALRRHFANGNSQA